MFYFGFYFIAVKYI